MPHFNADVARRSYAAPTFTPITFTIAGERFTAMREPSFGDTLELADAPEVAPETIEAAAFALARFIERMLPDEDRVRFKSALRSIPGTQAAVIVELGTWLAEQVTGNPTSPPASSRRGRSTTGGSSRKRTAGRSRSN